MTKQTAAARVRSNMLYNAKRRAEKKGVPFDLALEDLDWGDACPCCGKDFSSGGEYHARPSIDKLIAERGYVRSNIVFVCVRCNQKKADMTPKEMYQIADFFWEKIKGAIGAGAGSEDRKEE